MHIGGRALYDPSTAPGGAVRFKQILANVLTRADRVPTMTDTLVEVPFTLDHPYWKADGSFDPEFHIRHVALPNPGDWRQLAIQVSRLHARPLDRRKPLWEMYVIEGLDNVEGIPPGCFAVYSKVHHAAIDGVSGSQITTAVHDLTPDPGPAEEPPPIPAERRPSDLELLTRAQFNAFSRPFEMMQLAFRSRPDMARLMTSAASAPARRFMRVPRTRFNRVILPHRVFDGRRFAFDDIKAIKNAVESTTVNDVALAICGGALRRYLQVKGELPAEPLIAMAPVNTRTDAEAGTGGNQISQMFVPLATDVEDERERLLSIRDNTASAKEINNAIGARNMTDYSKFVPANPAAGAARLASQLEIANRANPMFNTVVTNVPGPQIPIYYTGAQLVSTYGLGPLFDGCDLFHSVSSYCGELTISVTSCREMLPDPHLYAQCIQDAFDALQTATVSPSTEEEGEAPPERSPGRVNAS